LSRFNTRKEHDQERVARLAERMNRNGFELTRALWAYPGDDGLYEVFAGGTRLEAARLANVNVAIVLHEGYTWQEISRLSDQDNENDEYHQPVSLPDIWAEYARLNRVEGWTQQEIADAKGPGVDRSLVSRRIGWSLLPKHIQDAVCSGFLTEFHLTLVGGECVALHNTSQWADWNGWRMEVLDMAINKGWNSRQLADRWAERKAAVERANNLIDKLPAEPTDEYVWEGDEIARNTTDWRAVFVAGLIEAKAKNAAAVDVAFNKVAKRITESFARKEAYDNKQDAEARRATEEANRAQAILDRWLNADCTTALAGLEDQSVRLLLTDPPYGVAFQSNRRTASGKTDKITNDASLTQALDAFNAMLDAIAPKLAEEAHVLVFTDWTVEAAFMSALQKHGLTIRGSLVWVKENHTSGDLTGSFAPKHERIIHAAIGRPEVSPRADDVLEYARESATDHPTEKPTALLRKLIECTTKRGDLVVDPFAGTGSTCVAASDLERDYFGCELDEHYWQQGFERLKHGSGS
jgi:site-specific DNA-methyltransferase (adenine-specific)